MNVEGNFGLMQDISSRKIEESNQNFLFEIAEKIRLSESADDLIFDIVQAVGRHLGVSRCLFMEITPDDNATIHKDFHTEGLPALEGKIPLSRFSPGSIEILRAGRTLINDDIKNNPRTAEFYEAGYKPLGMEAFVGVPLLRDGRWIAGLAVVHGEPRHWSESEINLLESIAERLWLSVEKLRINDALRQSREVMRLAMETANIYSWQFDLTTRKIVFSGNVKKVVGFALPEDFDELVKFIHEDERETVLRDLRETFENKNRYNRETRYVNPETGEIVWLQTQGAFIRGGEGELTRFVGITQNITERKRAERELTEYAGRQEALYHLADQLHRTKSLEDVYEAALEAIIGALHCDRASILLYDNNNVMRFVAWRGLPDEYRRAAEGHSPWQPDEKNPQPVYISDIKFVEIDAELKKVIESEGISALAFIPLVSNGRLIGKFMAYSNTPRDFTENDLELGLTIARQLAFGIERKRAEEQFHYQLDLTRTITDNTQSCLWMMDTEGICTFANHATERITGFKPEELVGEVLHNRIHHKRPDGTLFPMEDCPFVESLASHEPIIGYEDYFIHQDGHFFPVRCNASPIFRNGVLFGTVLEVQDITEEKRIAQEREALLEREQQLRKQAEDANRMKDEFLATVSHELRTPLNAIFGWSTMVRQNNFDQEVLSRAFEIIERNARNQNQIISDILDVSRVITGKLNLNLQPVELSSVIKAAVDTVRPAIDAKRIRLETYLEPGGEPVSGDADRLQQIIWNLLSNAVKFTPEGGKIETGLRYQEDFAEIIVSDNGSGIEPEFLPFVFDRFSQGDSKTTRKYGGLGLGLAIVRHLVELHGGDVFVTSGGTGQGSVFTIRLPLKNRAARLPKEQPGISLADSENKGDQTARQHLGLEGLKVLAVDDEADSLELVNFLLTNQGAKVFTAASVDQALEIFEKENPDLVISDIGMPERDGYELIREIKAHQNSRNHTIPVLALTAYARAEDNRRILASGFEAFLPKPVEPRILIEKIIQIVNESESL